MEYLCLPCFKSYEILLLIPPAQRGTIPFSCLSFRVLGFLYISASNQAAADAKVVLTLCTPTYIQQGYTFIVNSDIYNYVSKSELL